MEYDVVVIGGGPGGYVAAIRAAQLGLSVACIEKEDRLGGTCLRIGCIPSKALLESSHRFHMIKHDGAKHGIVADNVTLDLAAMLSRKDGVVNNLTKGIDGLFKKNKVTRILGHGTITAQGKVTAETADGPQEVSAKNIIIATGSKSAPLPGVELDYDLIGTSTEALSYPEVPDHLVVIGAGVIGLELGSVWARLGSKVTVLEYMDGILPGMDAEVTRTMQRQLKRQGLKFQLKTKVTSAKVVDGKCVVEAEGKDPLECDRVLLAVGRIPNTEKLGLESVGIETDKRGRIPVDAHLKTSVDGIYAIGDVIAGPMLAHKAEEEGIAAVENIAGKVGHVDYDLIPGVVYTHPEVASVGKTEEQLKEAGIEYKKGSFPYLASGRAQGNDDTAGSVKILADATTDRIIGCHIIGAAAGELIAEVATAMNFGASAEDIALCCHAHPTLAEATKEAAMAVAGRAIHM